MPKKRVRKSSIKQRLRRREGDVKRLEVVLMADSERDQWVSRWLDDHLGKGETSEFVRKALLEKIGRIVGGSDTGDNLQQYLAELFEQYEPVGLDPDRLQERFDALADAINELHAELQSVNIRLQEALAKIGDQQEEIHILRLDLLDAHREIDDLRRELDRRPAPPPTLPEVTTASSGLDMSRPRSRALPSVRPAPEREPDALSDDDQVRLAKIFANSVKRAQPGRGG